MLARILRIAWHVLAWIGLFHVIESIPRIHLIVG